MAWTFNAIYVVVFFYHFNDLRFEVVVRFIDIGGNNHPRLYIICIIYCIYRVSMKNTETYLDSNFF